MNGKKKKGIIEKLMSKMPTRCYVCGEVVPEEHYEAHLIQCSYWMGR